MVEIGAFLGGGTRKLSEFLTKNKSPKKIFVLDIFDIESDRTVDTDGNSMANVYRYICQKYEYIGQREIFYDTIRSCRNIIVIEGDSRLAKLNTDNICFGFIDGSHDPEIMEHDFYLLWERLSPKGCIAFHDYRKKLPFITERIDDIIQRHKHEIITDYSGAESNILFIRSMG